MSVHLYGQGYTEEMEKPIKRKIRKSAVEARVKAAVEKHGGKYLSINWKKQKVHILTPNGQHVTEFLTFK